MRRTGGAERAEEADYLLDVKPYGYRTPVNVEYLSGVQSVSSLLQPGAETVVGRSEGDNPIRIDGFLYGTR